jgi:hypothetical protein
VVVGIEMTSYQGTQASRASDGPVICIVTNLGTLENAFQARLAAKQPDELMNQLACPFRQKDPERYAHAQNACLHGYATIGKLKLVISLL